MEAFLAHISLSVVSEIRERHNKSSVGESTNLVGDWILPTQPLLFWS